jgi:chaperone required for assembly of F1-ATPase
MEEGFALALDDRPVNTPGRWPLVVPTRALADAVAHEWRVQGSTIRPETMPLMQLAATVLDHIGLYRAEVMAATLRYAETDAICYRADQPAALVRLQSAAWDPLVEWLAADYGVRLNTVSGIVPVAQPAETLDALRRAMEEMDDWRLCAFQSAASSSGSFVIALALLDGRLDAEDAFRVAEIDASFEIDHWGEDPVATARRATVAADLAAARRFHDLLGH